MANSVESISLVSLTYHDKGRKLDYEVGGVILSVFVIFLICLYSNEIPESYGKFLGKFEDLELRNCDYHGKLNIDYGIVNRMYSMGDEMCLTAFDLYKINSKTFMSIISLIITWQFIWWQIGGILLERMS